MTTAPTLEKIAEISGGKIARDGATVVVSYGPLGYFRVRPTTIFPQGMNGPEIPAVVIDGRLARASGAKHAQLRAKFEAAGVSAS